MCFDKWLSVAVNYNLFKLIKHYTMLKIATIATLATVAVARLRPAMRNLEKIKKVLGPKCKRDMTDEELQAMIKDKNIVEKRGCSDA